MVVARIGPRSDGTSHLLAMVSCIGLCLSLPTPAHAEETAALRLARNVQALQAQYGSYAPQVLPPLVELGTLYGGGQCEHALELLELAIDISHRSEGLLHPNQLGIYSTLMNCHIALDLPGELARAQRYVTLIHESQYGRDDPRLVQALEEDARRYEAAGLYLSARRLHDRALDVARSARGKSDLSLVEPLRGMARAYRLEYTYGLALPDIVDPVAKSSNLRSLAAEKARFDPRGEKSLEQAVAILRKHPEARRERIDTLVELGDWHQLGGHHRAALTAYREAWNELHAADAPDHDLFRNATPLLFRPKNGVTLRRAPPEDSGLRKYTIDLAYRVTRDGEPKDVTVIETNAPRALTERAMADMRDVLHRPKFENGEPVADQGLQYRRNVYARARHYE